MSKTAQKFFTPTKVDPKSLIIVGLDTQDGPEHVRYDERVKLAIDPAKVLNVKEFGILQAATVVRTDRGLEVVLGRQRVREAREAGVEIPIVIVDWDDKKQYGAMISENHVRKGENAMVAARKMETYLNLCMADVSDDKDEAEAWREAIAAAANAFGCSPAKIKQYQKLLDLDPEVQAKVEKGELAAYEVMGLRGLSAEKQIEVAEKKAENKAKGVREHLDGDESRQLRVSKQRVRALAAVLPMTYQLALLWAVGDVDEAAALEDAGFRKAMAETKK